MSYFKALLGFQHKPSCGGPAFEDEYNNSFQQQHVIGTQPQANNHFDIIEGPVTKQHRVHFDVKTSIDAYPINTQKMDQPLPHNNHDNSNTEKNHDNININPMENYFDKESEVDEFESHFLQLAAMEEGTIGVVFQDTLDEDEMSSSSASSVHDEEPRSPIEIMYLDSPVPARAHKSPLATTTTTLHHDSQLVYERRPSENFASEIMTPIAAVPEPKTPSTLLCERKERFRLMIEGKIMYDPSVDDCHAKKATTEDSRSTTTTTTTNNNTPTKEEEYSALSILKQPSYDGCFYADVDCEDCDGGFIEGFDWMSESLHASRRNSCADDVPEESKHVPRPDEDEQTHEREQTEENQSTTDTHNENVTTTAVKPEPVEVPKQAFSQTSLGWDGCYYY